MLAKGHVIGSLAFVHAGIATYAVIASHQKEPTEISVFGFPVGTVIPKELYPLSVGALVFFTLLLLRVGMRYLSWEKRKSLPHYIVHQIDRRNRRLRTGYLLGFAFCLGLLLLLDDMYGKVMFDLTVMLLCFVIGCLLPDIDEPSSFLGRYVPVLGQVIGHRTWTHTIWAVIGLFVLALVFQSPYILALTVGYFVHVWEDAFSNAGVCWLYPFKNRYEVITKMKDGYPEKFRIKRGKRFKYRYRVGGKFEQLFVAFSLVVHLLCVLVIINLT